MQLVIADWRLAIEHKANKNVAQGNTQTKIEKQARRARMMQTVENERRMAQDQMLLGGASVKF